MLRALIIFLWLICIAVAMVATFQLAIGMLDGTWGAVIFWWAVVVVAFWYDRKHKVEAK